MTTTTIPLSVQDKKLLDFLLEDRQIASTKADVFRRALRKLAEEEAVANVLEASEEVKVGKVFAGDIDDLAKKLKV